MLDPLEERGPVPGCVLAVVEARELDGVVTAADEGGGTHTLGEVLARAVSVQAEPGASSSA